MILLWNGYESCVNWPGGRESSRGLEIRNDCSVYKGKGEREVCGNHRGICLLSVIGKIYGRILIDRVRYITGAGWGRTGGI